jgi:hypothetical protein
MKTLDFNIFSISGRFFSALNRLWEIPVSGFIAFTKNKLVLIFAKTILAFVAVSVFMLFLAWFAIYAAPASQNFFTNNSPQLIAANDSLASADFYKKNIATTQKELATLSDKYAALTPTQPYLVINTTKNHFYLYRNKAIVREGFCSSGSYVWLKSNDREWLFKTPKGIRTVKGKTRAPVWKKPDWAFIEDGLPVPSADHHSRFEAGVLGDYALSLGDGYLIHGTIYKRFLGMPVTHGCVRLADDDLEAVYNALSIGSKVYIY